MIKSINLCYIFNRSLITVINDLPIIKIPFFDKNDDDNSVIYLPPIPPNDDDDDDNNIIKIIKDKFGKKKDKE